MMISISGKARHDLSTNAEVDLKHSVVVSGLRRDIYLFMEDLQGLLTLMKLNTILLLGQ